MYKVNNRDLYELQPKRSQTEHQVSSNLKIFEQTLNENNVKQDKGFCALMLGLYNYNKAVNTKETIDKEVLNKAEKYFKQAKNLSYFCVSSYFLSCIYFENAGENKKELEKAQNLLQEVINRNQEDKVLTNEVENVVFWVILLDSKLKEVTEKIEKVELEKTLSKKSQTLKNKNKEVKELQIQMKSLKQREEIDEQDIILGLILQVLKSLELGLDEFFDKSCQEIEQALEKIDEEKPDAYKLLLGIKLYQQGKLHSNPELLESAINNFNLVENNGLKCISLFCRAYIYYNNIYRCDLPHKDRIRVLEKAKALLETINLENLRGLKQKPESSCNYQWILEKFQKKISDELGDIRRELNHQKYLATQNEEVKRLEEELNEKKQQIAHQEKLKRDGIKRRKKIEQEAGQKMDEKELEIKVLIQELEKYKERKNELNKEIKRISEISNEDTQSKAQKIQLEIELKELRTTMQVQQQALNEQGEYIKKIQMQKEKYLKLQNTIEEANQAKDAAERARKDAELQKKAALVMIKKAKEAKKKVKNDQAKVKEEYGSLEENRKKIEEMVEKAEKAEEKARETESRVEEQSRYLAEERKKITEEGYSLLIEGIQEKDENKVKKALDQGFIPSDAVKNGDTGWHCAVQEEYFYCPVVRLLCEYQYSNPEHGVATVWNKENELPLEYLLKNINNPEYARVAPLIAKKTDFYEEVEDIFSQALLKRTIKVTRRNSANIDAAKITIQIYLNHLIFKGKITRQDIPYLITIIRSIVVHVIDIDGKLINLEELNKLLPIDISPLLQKRSNMCVVQSHDDTTLPYLDDTTFNELSPEDQQDIQELEEYYNKLLGSYVTSCANRPRALDNVCAERQVQVKRKFLRLPPPCIEWHKKKKEAIKTNTISYTEQLKQKILGLEQKKVAEPNQRQEDTKPEDMPQVQQLERDENLFIESANIGALELIQWLGVILEQKKYDLATDCLDILLSSAEMNYLADETLEKIVEESLNAVESLWEINRDVTFRFCDRIMGIVEGNNKLHKYKFNSVNKRLKSLWDQDKSLIGIEPQESNELPYNTYREIMKNVHAKLQASANNSQKKDSIHGINNAEILYIFGILRDDIMFRLGKSRDDQVLFKNISESINNIGEKLLCVGEYKKAWDFYREIKSKINRKWVELDSYLLTVLSHISRHWQNKTIPQNSYLFDWQKYREQLLCHRHALTGSELQSIPQNIITTVSIFTQNMRNLISTILADCIWLLGPAPCKFCFLSMGSMSRGEMMPYSDVECAVLLEKQSEVTAVSTAFEKQNISTSYFARLLYLFEYKMLSIGEYSPAGFHLDSEGHPGAEMRLCGTSTGIIKSFISDEDHLTDGLAYSLFHAEYIDGNDGKQLFFEYQKSLQEMLLSNHNNQGRPFYQFFAIKHLEQHLKDFDKNTLEIQSEDITAINIKEHIYCWLHYALFDLAMYHNLPVKNMVEAINGLVNYQQFNLPLELKEQIINTIAYIHNLRIQTQTANGEQKEKITREQQPNEVEKLLKIYNSIVLPIYNKIKEQLEKDYKQIEKRTIELSRTSNEVEILARVKTFFEVLEIDFLLNKLTIYDVEEQVFWLFFTFQNLLTNNMAVEIIKQLSGMNNLPTRLDAILSGLLKPALRNKFETQLYYPVDHMVICRIARILGKTFYLEKQLDQVFKLRIPYNYRQTTLPSLSAPFRVAPHASLFTPLTQQSRIEYRRPNRCQYCHQELRMGLNNV